MVAPLSFATVSLVLDSWEAVKKTPDFEAKGGDIIFAKFFALEPEAKVIFGFKENDEISHIRKANNGGFGRHAVYFIQMIDKALAILGPDFEILSDILEELGLKHLRYGVKPTYFPTMGKALVSTIEELLKDEFTKEAKDAWIAVYGALSYDMIQAQIHQENQSQFDAFLIEPVL